MKSIFESVVQRCTKYIQAMTSRQALAKMFMYASITHCQGKITQRALALWHLHSWHLDVPPKACNSRREIQGPKGPVLFCQSNGETIGTTATKKEYEYYIISRSSRNSHHQKLDTCQGFVRLLIFGKPTHAAKVTGLWSNWLQVRVVSS